jgi:epoxyqueuosine reductase
LFARTAIKRTGRDRFVRNVLIAIGNSGDPALAPCAERLLDDPAAIVRGAAVWALGRLVAKEDMAALRAEHAGTETDPSVREEWEWSAG